MSRPSSRSAALFVVVASTAFATSGPLARYARPLDPLWIAAGRCGLAGLVLLAWERAGVLASLRGMTARQRWAVAGAGALLAAHFGLFLVGLDRTSLPAAVSLVSLEPLGVVLCAWALSGIRPTRLELVGVALATGGAGIVATGAGTGEHRLDGDLLVLAAVLLFGFYVSAARGLRDALPARSYAAVVYSVAAVTLAIAAPLVPARAGTVGWPVPVHAALAVVALALVPTLIGHTAVQTAARTLSPSTVALASPGETLGGILIGAVSLGAIPTGTEIAGALVIVAGATVAVLGAPSPRHPLQAGEDGASPRLAIVESPRASKPGNDPLSRGG